MEFKYIEAFLKIAETGNFSAAAEALYISQSTISTRIKCLEKGLNTTLFERNNGKKVGLTESGRLIYPRLREAHRLLMESLEITNVKSPQKRKLTISCPAYLADYIYPELATVSHSHAFDFSFIIGTSSKTIDLIRKGEIDIGFAYLESKHDDNQFSMHHIGNVKAILFCAPEHPLLQKSRLTLSDMEDERIIIYHRGFLTYVLINKFFKNHGIHLRHEMVEIQNFDWIKKLVKEQQGIGILQNANVSNEILNTSLVELKIHPPLPPTPFYLVCKNTVPEHVIKEILTASNRFYQKFFGDTPALTFF